MERNVPLNPLAYVPKHLKPDVVANLTKQLKKPETVRSPEDIVTLKLQHRRNSMPATYSMSLNTIERFHTEDELDNTASPREESVL